MDLNSTILLLRDYLWGWPLIITMLSIGSIVTIVTGFVQLRYFTRAWRLLLIPKKNELGQQKGAEITPIQAFLGALGTSIGNGNIIGSCRTTKGVLLIGYYSNIRIFAGFGISYNGLVITGTSWSICG